MLFSTSDLDHQTHHDLKSALQSDKTVKRFLSVQEDLATIIPTLEMGDVLEWMTDGRWSSHNLTAHLLKLAGPSDLLIATWAITQEPLEMLERLKTDGSVKRLEGLFESKIQHHNPKAWHYAKGVFDDIWTAKCHAKVTVITNENWNIAVVSSANWTRNRRIEAGVICAEKAVRNFTEIGLERSRMNLTEAKKLGELLFTEHQIQIILSTDATDPRTAILQGQLLTEAEVRKTVIAQAKAGSAEAQKMVAKWIEYINRQKLK